MGIGEDRGGEVLITQIRLNIGSRQYTVETYILGTLPCVQGDIMTVRLLTSVWVFLTSNINRCVLNIQVVFLNITYFFGTTRGTLYYHFTSKFYNLLICFWNFQTDVQIFTLFVTPVTFKPTPHIIHIQGHRWEHHHWCRVQSQVDEEGRNTM